MAEPIFDKEGNLTNLDELQPEEVAAAYKEKNKVLFGRMTEAETRESQAKADLAKAKAEAEAKVVPPTAPPISPDPEEKDELRLIARGLSDEEITEAKDIAKGKGLTLLEALKTPLFQLFQESLKDAKRKEDAKLPASHGSSQFVPVEGIKPGQTKEEHEAVFRKALGKDTA